METSGSALVASGTRLGLSQASGEGGEQFLRQRRDLVEDGRERRVLEDVEPAVAARPKGGGARTAVEQRKLTEVVADVQLGDRLVPALDHRLAAGEHEELVPRLSF